LSVFLFINRRREIRWSLFIKKDKFIYAKFIYCDNCTTTKIFQSFQKKSLPINLDLIEKHFSAGEQVTPQILAEKGLVSGNKGSELDVKVLATGEITKKLAFSGLTFSVSAKAKIEKAGGMTNTTPIHE